MLVYQVDLLQRELACGYIELVLWGCAIAIFRQKCLQILRKSCTVCILRGSCSGFRSVLHREESKANLLVALLHFLEFGCVDEHHRRRIKNRFFLVHQVAGIFQQFLLLGNESLFFVFGEQSCRLSDDVAHEIIECPHHGCRTCKTLLLQHRIELILLALVVQGILVELFVYFEPLILNHRILNQVFNGKQQLSHLVVFAVILHNGVVVGKLWARVIHKAIEQFERLAYIHSNTFVVVLLHHCLLYQRNVERLYFAHLLAKSFPCLFERYLSCFIQFLYFKDFI